MQLVPSSRNSARAPRGVWLHWAAVACVVAVCACRNPENPSGVDLLGRDAGAPRQNPEVDPSSDKPVGPIAAVDDASPRAAGGSGPSAPPPRDIPGGGRGVGGGSGAGGSGKVPIGSSARSKTF